MAKKVILEKYNHRKLTWLHDGLIFLAMVGIVFFVFNFVIGISYVSGDSMYPTLSDGELVVYLRTEKNYEKGDIVSLWVPSGVYYVKRIIAVGGDVVDVKDGKVFVNGQELEDDYGYGESIREEGAVIYPYKVREGNYFVMGDNREVSVDSRAFGEVNSIQISGKLILRGGRWYIESLTEDLNI